MANPMSLPGDTDALLRLADALAARQEWDRARTVYQQAIQLDPSHEEGRLAYAGFLTRIESFDDAARAALA